MSTIRTSHAFNVEEAIKYGVEKAILLQHIRFWCVQNEGKKDNLHDGRVWMYQSVEDMHKHYPYWSTHKLHRMLKSMEDEGLILSGNYNKIGYDRTKWYSINLHSANPPNGTGESATPIQILNKILKQIVCLMITGLCTDGRVISRSLRGIGLSYLNKIKKILAKQLYHTL